MNQSTPLSVAAGTIASSVTGALITGTYALAKRKGQVVASVYAASAAVNCGTAGAIFFSIRGYVIVPLLIHTLPSRLHERKNDLGNGSVSSEAPVNGAMASWGA
ncbi:hypothetical protein BC826DRAFT_491355 [Russula brevipes]|nr:hypothetical protein BC826DRAFT_491355 [Russula brevipes]